MSKFKILVVEDDAIESMDIQRRLEIIGYEVPYTASRGQEAIEKASEMMPDLVLMDISLKGDMTGIEAAKEIRNLDIPIIYLTAHSDEATVEKAKITEPYGYIIKPYDPNELKYALEMAIYKSKNDKKLKESEVILKALLNASNDSVLLLDTKGRFLAVNSAASNRLGFKEEELLKNSFKDYINPKVAKNRWEYVKKAINSKNMVEFEDKRNGIYFHHTINPIIEGNEVKKLAIFSRDITENKKAEEELRESEIKYQNALDNMIEGCQIIDHEWRYIYLNDAAIEHAKVKREDLIGHTMMEVYPGIQKTDLFSTLKKCKEEKISQGIENLFTYPDGTSKWFELSIHSVPEGLFILSYDLSQRKKSEQSLKISKERLKLALDSAGAALFDLEITTGNAYLSPEYYAMFGYEPDEFPPTYDEWANLIHPEDLENTISHLDKQLKNKKEYLKIEYRAICKDKSIKWILGTAKAVKFDENGFATRIIGVNIDVTQQKILEEKLELTQYSVDNAQDMIFWVDSQGKIVYANASASEKLGYSTQELQSRTIFDELDPNFDEDLWKKYWEEIKKVGQKTIETQIPDKYGNLIDVSIAINLIDFKGTLYHCDIARDITVQKELERNLNENQRKIETLLGNLPGMAYRCQNDPQWTMEFVSAGCLELTGYHEKDLIDNLKLSYASLIHPDDREKVWRSIQRALKEKKHFTLSYRIIPADKQIKYVLERGIGVFSDDGELDALEGFISDVSALKKVENELIESENYLNNIINAIADPVFVKDKNHDWVLLNDAFCEFMGYSRDELIGKTDYDFFPEHEAEIFWEKDEEVFSSKQENVNEEEITVSGGNIIPVITKKTIYTDDNGEEFLIGVIRDISELNSAKKSLEDQYNFLQNILDSIPSPIFYKDINYKYQGCNRAFEDFTGIPKEEIIGKTVYDVNPPELADKFHTMDEELFRNLGEQKYEAPVQSKDGSIHEILFIKNTYNDPEGNLAGMIGVMSDITEIKNAEKSMRISQEEYQGIFENINTAVAVYETTDNGDTFIFKDFNRAGAEIEKVDQKEVIGKKITDVFPGVEEFGILDAIKKVWKTGLPEKFPLGFYKDERISGWRENYIYKLPSGEVVAVYEDMTAQKQALEEIELNQERLKVLVKILQYNPQSVQDLLDYALEQSIELTQSKIGYIYHYYPDKKQFVLNTWSKGVMDKCSLNEPNNVYELDKTGIWGEAVRQRKSFIINDFQAPHPLKKGYPEGHAPLYKYMTLPVFSKGDIVAVVGVANKETDYTQTDLLQLELLMDAVWKMVDRQKAEEALKKSETEYRAIFENTGTATAISENDMSISLANEEFAQLTGYSKDKIENKMAWTEFFVEEQLERMKKFHRLRRIDPEKAPKNYESQVIDRSGNIKDVYMSVSIIPGTKKSLVSVLDITEKKQSRAKLKRELKINQSLARIYAPIISPDSNIEDVASIILDEAKELTGSEQGFVSSIDPETKNNIGHTLTRMMPDCDVMIEEKTVTFPIGPDGTYGGLWGYCLNTGKSFFTNSPQTHESSKGIPEGHVKLERFISTPVFYGESLVGQIALANSPHDYTQNDLDVLERLSEFYAIAIHSKDVEKEIKESLEEKETLLREIHHRVKNNMQIVSSLLNLQKYMDLGKDPVHLIEDSQNRIKTMSLVHELLYQSGRLSKVNLKNYIEKLTYYLFEQFSASERKIRLITELEENYLNIETAVPCCLIVNELVSNSLKHAFPGGDGEINVRFHEVNNKYELIVQDNGIGLPKDFDIEKDSTLGLYLINSLVNQIDGELEIKNEDGAKFRIVFEELKYAKRL